MNSPSRPSGPPPAPSAREANSDEEPGVPGFRQWRGVYFFVGGVFALTVILLALFSRYFS